MSLPTTDQEKARSTRGYFAVGAVEKTDGAILTLNTATRRVWVGGTGTLVCTFADGSVATLQGIPTGTMLEIAVTSIAASSTATKVVALL